MAVTHHTPETYSLLEYVEAVYYFAGGGRNAILLVFVTLVVPSLGSLFSFEVPSEKSGTRPQVVSVFFLSFFFFGIGDVLAEFVLLVRYPSDYRYAKNKTVGQLLCATVGNTWPVPFHSGSWTPILFITKFNFYCHLFLNECFCCRVQL